MIKGNDMKYTEDVYLKYDPFYGSDRAVEIRQYSWKMVKTRKEHDCILSQLIGKDFHTIPAGSFSMKEKAIVDDIWNDTYSCMECMDEWLEENFLLD